MSCNGEEDGRSVQAEGESITSKHHATTPLLLNDSQSTQCNISGEKEEVGGLKSNEDSETKYDSKGQQNECSGVDTSCSSTSSSGLGNVTDSVRDNASCKSSSSTITCEEEEENTEIQEILNEHEDKMDKTVERGEMVRSSDEDDSPESKLLGTGNSKNCISKDAKLLNNENCKDCDTRKKTQHVNTKRLDEGCDGLNLEQDSIDTCGSPSSDITEPELAKVNLAQQENWSSSDRKSCKDSAYSDSPSSEFECSASSSVASCAEDSGISSTVRDEEMEEIPLADGSYSPNLFQEMSRISVDDMVSSWVPKSKNTYAPNIARKTSSSVSLLDNTDSRNLPQQTKMKELFSDSGIETNQTTVGWKLFGKVPPKETPTSQSSSSFSRDDVKRSSMGEKSSSSRKPKFLSLKRNNTAVPSSTTALIFENRPRNLPAKSPSEEKKHRQQYEAMVAQARKKELQEAKKQEKQAKVKSKQEKVIATAAAVWANELLPNWETVKTSRRAKELWWQGIPPSVRGRVWKLAIGNDLQITNELFDIFQAHAYEKLLITRNNKKRLKESKSVAELPTNNFIPVVNSEHKVELIMLDVSRTFPSLCIFQEGGPFHDVLHSILGAYTCYRPDVGYVQGMSFIAAVLLLNMEPPDAFVCFANLLNKPCQLVFFRVDHPMMKAYFATFEILLEEFLPKVGNLFFEENFSPDMYLIDWIFTLFSKSLPLDVACRVWDVFCRDGDDFLFRTALGILKFYQTELIGMDFIHLGQFLSKLPDDISANKLFDCISSISLSRQKFNQILAQQKELATQIKTVTASAGGK